MPARTTFSAIACSSPADAIRLANGLMTSWAGPSAKPDLIEVNGSEVDLTWFSINVSFSQLTSAVQSAAQPSISVKQYRHSDGRSVTTQNN